MILRRSKLILQPLLPLTGMKCKRILFFVNYFILYYASCCNLIFSKTEIIVHGDAERLRDVTM